MSNQISRDQTVCDLKTIPYNSVDELIEDKIIFKKIIGMRKN